MNKKFLTKTLLPISTVVLLGGGIASSLTLTSCSKKDGNLTFTNIESINKYLDNHSINPLADYDDPTTIAGISTEKNACELQDGIRVQAIYFDDNMQTYTPTSTWHIGFGTNDVLGVDFECNYISTESYSYSISFSGIPEYTLYDTQSGFLSQSISCSAYYWNAASHVLSFSIDYTTIVSDSIFPANTSSIRASFYSESVEYYDEATWDYFASNITKQTIINLLLFAALVLLEEEQINWEWVKIINLSEDEIEMAFCIVPDEKYYFSQIAYKYDGRWALSSGGAITNWIYPNSTDSFSEPTLITTLNTGDYYGGGYYLEYTGNYIEQVEKFYQQDKFCVGYSVRFTYNANYFEFVFI